jgi:membrane protease YdiL (CAAX protease family)
VELVSGAVVGALLLSWLEESIFRGMVFRMFYTAVRPHLAVILASLAFAVVHFKDVPFPPGADAGWYAGLWVAAQQSVSFAFTAEWTELANYFLVGLVLCLVFLRTQSLVACFALHAGWVAARGVWWDVVDIPGGSAAAAFWGTESLVDGYGALLMLSSLAAAFYVSWQQAQRRKTFSVERLT